MITSSSSGWCVSLDEDGRDVESSRFRSFRAIQLPARVMVDQEGRRLTPIRPPPYLYMYPYAVIAQLVFPAASLSNTSPGVTQHLRCQAGGECV